MSTVLDIILPIFGLVFFGYLSGRAKWITEAGIEGLSSFVFTIAIPIMLFHSIASAELPEQIPWNFIFAYYAMTLTLFGFCLASGRLSGLDVTEASVFAMSGVYSNVVLLGIPLVLTSFGDTATIPLFIIVSTNAAIMFLPTTFFAELGRGNKDKLLLLPLQTVKVLASNQIVLGIVLGLITNLLNMSLPGVIDKTAAFLGGAALPCAVFSIGASISRYKISGEILRISMALGIKNLAHPLLVWLACARLFHLEPTWTAVAVVLAACPTGINAYLFANRYQVIVASTATVVVLSTAVSVPILSLVLVLLTN